MSHDVIIIGGSFAGLSAALQLGRARRDVLVIDAGENRNRFAHEAHGVIGHDGKAPATILEEARAELSHYPTIRLQSARVETATKTPSGFEIGLDDGTTVTAQRVILATGVVDTLPDIPGLREHWGTSVFHCPYCHGFEVADRPLAIIATGELSVHQATLLTDWTSDLTVFTNGYALDIHDDRVKVETRPVVAVEDEGIRLADGELVPVAGSFVTSRTTPAGDLAEQLGCRLADTPAGQIIEVNGFQETSVPFVFAAGDGATMMQGLTAAIASGTMAAVAAHRSLLFEPAGV